MRAKGTTTRYRLGGQRKRDGETQVVTIIGLGFAGVAAFGGVAFLVKMAYWQPEKRSSRKEQGNGSRDHNSKGGDSESSVAD